ncbi:MAG TPA: heme NO-binding domain-containing protein [Actinomycetota bacterium]
MKGIVFSLFEQVVTADRGEEAWDSVLDEAGSTGAYTAVGNYPDEDFMRLVEAAAGVLAQPPDETVRWFGRGALPLLAERYPSFFEGHESTRAFLLTLNNVIHPEVRKLFPGSYAPEFDFDDTDPDQLVLGYVSHRNLCSFGEGLILGAADHFGERVELSQQLCSKRGDPKCTFVCRFLGAA